jgi:hexosaminidase
VSRRDLGRRAGAWVVALLCALGALLPFACTQHASTAHDGGLGDAAHTAALIPLPLRFSAGEGSFLIDGTTRLVLDESLLEWQLDAVLLEIVDPGGRFGLSVTSMPAASSAERPVRAVPGIQLALGGEAERLGPEGYELSVTPERVTLTASAAAGVFYGLQTLRQLLPDPEAGYSTTLEWALRSCEIFDRPRFPWRGQLLDVSRHFLPLEFVLENIDELARLKLNVFHWHLTDDQGWRVPIAALPRLTSVGAWRVDRNDEPWWGRAEAAPGEIAHYGGFYSREQIEQVVEYARLRFVTVMPEIDFPGHSRAAIAAHPEVSCDGVPRAVATGGIADQNTLCPGKEQTFAFVQTVLDEVMDLFPSRFVHIGGDECNKTAWAACDDCQARKLAEGLETEEQLQSYFIGRVERFVNSRGRSLIGWDEILEGGLAPGAAVMSWRGEEGGIAAARAGHSVVMTPHSSCYLDLKQGDPELEPPLGYSQCLLSTVYAYDPVPAELLQGGAEFVLGVQGNLWGESIQRREHAHYMLFPRLLAIAEVAWTPPALRDWDAFVDRLEPALQRLEQRGIGAARSLYDVAIDVAEGAEGEGPVHGFVVTLSTEHGRVPIHYTLDGSEPTAHSTRYVEPLPIESSTRLRAASFRAEQRLGRIVTKALAIHLAAGRRAELVGSPSDQYRARGVASLTDCSRGSLVHADGRWLGFQGVSLEATLDLGSLTPLSRVTLGCLQSQGSWIFLPSSLSVSLSDDGISWRRAGTLTPDALTRRAEPALHDLSVHCPGERARHVRVRAESVGTLPAWHPGRGGESWLFVDEIVIE